MKIQKLKIFTISILLSSTLVGKAQDKMNILKLKTAKDLHELFRYTNHDVVLISGHRGGMVPGFPENSIATFENTLKHTPAFFEIDPRLTKDSVIVLLHDATLDRTTTGKGKLSDYTFEELKQLRLKDAEGNITRFGIPTLEETITWARGKTVLNLDHKDVPLQMTADLLRKHKADAFMMVTVHSVAEAKFYLADNKDRMFSAFIRNIKEYEEYEKSGVPFTQLIAYIGPLVKPENQELYALLHKRGTMCMISAASSYDKLKTPGERKTAYISIANDGASVLESDRPIEAAEAIRDFQKRGHSKERFFGKK